MKQQKIILGRKLAKYRNSHPKYYVVYIRSPENTHNLT